VIGVKNMPSNNACRLQRVDLPHRARVVLALERLEERWLPNATMLPPSSPPPPPSFFQAALTLFRDGIQLGQGRVNQYLFHIDVNDAYPVPLAALNASITSNSPYVGPLAPMFVLAGGIIGAEVQYQQQLLGFQSF
jgi:hypothetical protein